MIHVFEPAQEAHGSSLWSGPAVEARCTVHAIEPAQLEPRVRTVAAEPGAIVVLDAGFISALGAPAWLRELPALCETRLVVGRRFRPGSHGAAAWLAAVDAVLTSTDVAHLEADVPVRVVTDDATLLDACEPMSRVAVTVVERSRCHLPTKHGTFDVVAYEIDGKEEALLVSRGDLSTRSLFVRIHSECWTGEALASLKCDCDGQLRMALAEIDARGNGALVYLRQEGRGIGLANKIRAYSEQDKGADTIEANRVLGLPVDARDFTAAAEILCQGGVTSVELMTNNPHKVRTLRAGGIHVSRVLPSALTPTPHNVDYLRTKLESLGHLGLQRALPPMRESSVRDPERTLLIFDLDGVIQFGERIASGAITLIEKLRAVGFTIRFLTNDGFNSRASRVRQLRAGGLEAPESEIYTASYLAARYVADRGPVLLLAGEPASDEFERIPQSRTDPTTVVLADWFPHYDHALLQTAFEALERGAELVAVHRKPSWRKNGQRLIDVGMWVAGLEHCAGKQATIVGKPSAFAYDAVIEDAGFTPANTIVISDEVEPDLDGAVQHGLAAVLFDPSQESEFAGDTVDSYEALARLLTLPPGHRCVSS